MRKGKRVKIIQNLNKTIDFKGDKQSQGNVNFDDG